MPIWPRSDQPQPVSASLPAVRQEIGCVFFATFFAQAKKVEGSSRLACFLEITVKQTQILFMPPFLLQGYVLFYFFS
jgi:hypothetical protein